MEATGERFRERRRAEREVSHRFDVPDRDPNVLGERAVADRLCGAPERRVPLAALFVPGLALATGVAGYRRVDRDASSLRHHVGTVRRDHLAGSLVAGNQRQLDVERPLVEVDIGRTDAAGLDAYEDLLRAGGRTLALPNGERFGAGEDSGSHRPFSSARPSNDSPTTVHCSSVIRPMFAPAENRLTPAAPPWRAIWMAVRSSPWLR